MSGSGAGSGIDMDTDAVSKLADQVHELATAASDMANYVKTGGPTDGLNYGHIAYNSFHLVDAYNGVRSALEKSIGHLQQVLASASQVMKDSASGTSGTDTDAAAGMTKAGE